MQDLTKTARQIAGSPENHLNEVHLFTSAWAAMKAARGQGFNPARLRPQHLIEGPAPTPEPTDMVPERISHSECESMPGSAVQLHYRHAA